MTTLTVKMPEKLSLRLRDEAAGRGMNCSELIRRAVESMLQADDRPATGTCLSLAQDLAGCLDGASDLATNPKHMGGFGS
ncbi:MAG: ribbon-helix-helix protein, CopG family [bacterium]